jgi:hypothetical protein
MNKSITRKFTTLLFILLFIGVIIAPTINFNTVKASTEDDLVEVTTQACGIQRYGDTTVKLTREQYQNLEHHLVDFRARLNQTSTRDEAVPIFKDVVVELDKYGLLPKGMSVERVERLVTKSFNPRIRTFNSLDLDPDANYFCLVSGVTNETFCISYFYSFLNQITWYVVFNEISPLNLIFFPYVIWSFIGPFITSTLPFGLLSILTFGSLDSVLIGGEHHPSFGWISSIGLNGMKAYEYSELWGTAKDGLPIAMVIGVFPGVLGFTGIKITWPSAHQNTFFLGTALKVKIGTEFPGYIKDTI